MEEYIMGKFMEVGKLMEVVMHKIKEEIIEELFSNSQEHQGYIVIEDMDQIIIMSNCYKIEEVSKNMIKINIWYFDRRQV